MGSLSTQSSAAKIAAQEALLFGAHATYAAACASIICDSGIPTRSTAWNAAVATRRAWGSALPTSSDEQMTILRAMNLGSSPARSILAR